jgi:hypothetical protein
LKQGSERFTSNVETLYKRNATRMPDKWRLTNASVPQKWRCVLSRDLYNTPKGQACPSPTRLDPINIHSDQKDKKGPPVIGAARPASCMDTRAGIVDSPINVAINLNLDGASSQTTMEGTIPSLITQRPVPITGIMRASSSWASMPRGNRLNPNGNGPNAFGRDSPVWGWGAGQMKLVIVDSATEAETGWHMGSGVPSIEDSRSDLLS